MGFRLTFFYRPVDQTFGLLQSDSPDGDIGNPLELFPEPSHLVSLWKSIERKDVISALLVRALNEYQVLQSNSTSDPLRYVYAFYKV